MSTIQATRPSCSSKRCEPWIQPTCSISTFSFSTSVTTDKSTGLPNCLNSSSDALSLAFEPVWFISRSCSDNNLPTYIHNVHTFHLLRSLRRCAFLSTVATSTHTILEGQHPVVHGQLMDALPDDVSQNNFITLRNTFAVYSQLAQHQADPLRRQLGFFVPPL